MLRYALLICIILISFHSQAFICGELFPTSATDTVDSVSPDGQMEFSIRGHIVEIKSVQNRNVIVNYVLENETPIIQMKWSPDSRKIVFHQKVPEDSSKINIWFIDIPSDRMHKFSATLPGIEVESDRLEEIPDHFLELIGVTNKQLTEIYQNGKGYIHNQFFDQTFDPIWSPNNRTFILPVIILEHDLVKVGRDAYVPKILNKTIFLLFRAEEPFNLREEGFNKNLIQAIGFHEMATDNPDFPKYNSDGSRISYISPSGIKREFDAVSGNELEVNSKIPGFGLFQKFFGNGAKTP